MFTIGRIFGWVFVIALLLHFWPHTVFLIVNTVVSIIVMLATFTWSFFVLIFGAGGVFH